MRRYDSYIDSGIEVLGKVPSSWKKSKFKFQHFEQDERVGEDSTEYDLLSLTKKGIILRDIESGKGKFPESFDTYKKVKKDDLIFCLYDIEETPRTVGLSKLNGMITGSYKIFNSKDVITKFTYYTFLVIDDVKGLKPYYTGLRNVVRPETFKSLPFFIPPPFEQQQIVSFLDTKTSLIDSLIEKTQRKIELLKEKRTSLINEVVTKGLNPNVEMKDSDVKWIGEIPIHWEITKMKYGVNHLSEKGKPEKSDIKISPENVESDTGVCFNLYSEHESEGMRFQNGDILLNKLRLYLKKILYTEYDGFSLGEMIVLRTNDKLNNKYFYQLLFSQGLIDLLDSQSTGVKLPRVSPDVILNTEIIYPPLNEQQQIVEYLDEHTQKIDKIISIEEKRIELLKEYRQSLISEVVTGKRKVV